MKPTITPKEAADHGNGVLNGHTITMDGPQMSPPEFWSPFIITLDGEEYCCTGEPGDPITEDTQWLKLP